MTYVIAPSILNAELAYMRVVLLIFLVISFLGNAQKVEKMGKSIIELNLVSVSFGPTYVVAQHMLNGGFNYSYFPSQNLMWSSTKAKYDHYPKYFPINFGQSISYGYYFKPKWHVDLLVGYQYYGTVEGRTNPTYSNEYSYDVYDDYLSIRSSQYQIIPNCSFEFSRFFDMKLGAGMAINRYKAGGEQTGLFSFFSWVNTSPPQIYTTYSPALLGAFSFHTNGKIYVKAGISGLYTFPAELGEFHSSHYSNGEYSTLSSTKISFFSVALNGSLGIRI
jgi:hypothetical protein